MKPGNLVLVSGYKSPSLFLGWECEVDWDGNPADHLQTGMAQLLHNGRIIEVHRDYLITQDVELLINEIG